VNTSMKSSAMSSLPKALSWVCLDRRSGPKISQTSQRAPVARGLIAFATSFATPTVSCYRAAFRGKLSRRRPSNRLENARRQAELHHDMKTASAVLPDSFFYIDAEGGLETRAEYVAGIGVKSYYPEELKNEELKVVMYGDTAI